MKRVMKRIEVAKTAGFCFGVNRAVEMTYKLVESGKKVSTFGPLIHNPVVIEDLEKKGVRVIDSPMEALPGTTVVVRTHGVGASVYRSLEATGADICDATCPFVKKIHRIVGENSSPDIPVLIAGDSGHPEVIGIMGHCRGECFTFRSAEELKKLSKTIRNIPKKDNCRLSDHFQRKRMAGIYKNNKNTMYKRKCF